MIPISRAVLHLAGGKFQINFCLPGIQDIISLVKKRALTCLAVLFFFLAFFNASLSSVVHAQQGGPLVGTHLGEGDIPFQIEIIKMLKEKGAEDGFPITAQINMDANESEIQNLGRAAQDANFFTIVRINEPCAGFVNPNLISVVKNAFGPNSVIEFGNEVNNHNECPEWANYKSNLASLRSLLDSGLVGPSVLDFYNTQDLASDFLDFVPQYYNTQYTFANGYGCMGISTEECNPTDTNSDSPTLSYQLAYQPLQAQGKPFYITEFSLGPTANKDLAKVKTFIETHAEKTGALKITPLVFNVCNSQGQWLLYLHGEFYTNKGSKVNPESCSDDKAPFYLEPFKSLLTEEPNSADVFAELKSKHYRPVCVASWEFSPEVKVDDIEKALLEGQSRTVDGSLDIKDNVPTPYLRLAENVGGFASLENYLGTTQQDLKGDQVSDSIVGGPVYKMHTGAQRCEQQVQLLEKIREKCNQLQDPSECALDEQMPDSNYTPTQLLNEIQGSGISCDRLESTLETDLTPHEQEIRTALRQTELIMNKFYKLGFIIFIIEQETEASSGGLTGAIRKAFNFLEAKAPTSKQQMIVVSTKLPSTLTEEIDTETTSYQDSLHQTSSMLTPFAQQQQQKKDSEQLYTTGRAPNAPGPNFIDCNSEDCGKPLNQALENLTENYLDNPEDCMPFAQPIYEETEELKDVGDLSQLDEKYQASSGDGDLKAELEEQSFLDGVGSTIKNAAGEVISTAGNILARFFSTIEGNDTNKEKPAKPKLKMIYATQWSEQKQDIDNRLSYSFLSHSQVQALEEDEQRYPELSRMTESFLSSVFTEADFAPVRKPNCTPDPTDPTSCQSIAKATVMVGNSHEPGPPAGGSQMLFPAKYIVSSFGSALNDALQSWEQKNNKVESFLMGAKVPEKEGDKDTNSCVDSSVQHKISITNEKGETSQSAIVTNGVIQLAIEVSERTCTPVEVILGVFAKETSGLNYHGADASVKETVITGDPNESICRTEKCVTKDGGGSGPFSFTQSNFDAHIRLGLGSSSYENTVSPLYQECINGLSVTLSDGKKSLTAGPDARIMGHAMCAFSANFWRYMSLNKREGSGLKKYEYCTGANKRSYALSEITLNNLEYGLSIHCSPGSLKSDHPDHAFCSDAISRFKDAIDKLGGPAQNVINSCK